MACYPSECISWYGRTPEYPYQIQLSVHRCGWFLAFALSAAATTPAGSFKCLLGSPWRLCGIVKRLLSLKANEISRERSTHHRGRSLWSPGRSSHLRRALNARYPRICNLLNLINGHARSILCRQWVSDNTGQEISAGAPSRKAGSHGYSGVSWSEASSSSHSSSWISSLRACPDHHDPWTKETVSVHETT